MFVGVCGEIENGELSESQKERLLSKVSEMVAVKGEEGSFFGDEVPSDTGFWGKV